MYNRKAAHERLHRRIRKKISGTAQRPRLAIHFSGKHIYAQVIDDDTGRTLLAAATTQKDVLGENKPMIGRASPADTRKAAAIASGG